MGQSSSLQKKDTLSFHFGGRVGKGERRKIFGSLSKSVTPVKVGGVGYY